MNEHRTLTLEERATNADTLDHIGKVRSNLDQVVVALLERGREHDQSKLRDPEVATFARVTPRLAALTYGTPEYHANLADLGPALAHHYGHNRHHPEHFADGVAGMTLVDLVELLADWKAATMRHDDGDILHSLRVNVERFKLDPQVAAILRNTIAALGWSHRRRHATLSTWGRARNASANAPLLMLQQRDTTIDQEADEPPVVQETGFDPWPHEHDVVVVMVDVTADNGDAWRWNIEKPEVIRQGQRFRSTTHMPEGSEVSR